MDDLISRQAAVEVIDAVFPVDPMKSEYAQGIACGAALAKTYVEQLPSAQSTIEERKTGKWVGATVEEVGIYKVRTRQCTYCGKRAIDGVSVAGATMDLINNYCPNCGADMRGDKHEIN